MNNYEIDKTELQPFGSLEFMAKQVVEGFITGLHKSPFHGFSVEFAEHRQYNTGESTRNIDWKLYARTDKLFVKRFEEETNLRCNIIIDISSSMYFPVLKNPSINNPNKMFFSVYAAAAIAELMKHQRDAVGLSLFSDKVDVSIPAKSNEAHHRFIFNQLEKLLTQPTETKQTSAVKALHEIAETIHKRSLIILFSDMFDGSADFNDIFPALQHLKHNKHEVVIFHVVDKSHEIDFSFDNRPYKFIDMETNQELKLTPNEIKDVYIKRMNEYKQLLENRCYGYNIDLVEADINEGFNRVLSRYLSRRSKM